MFNCVFIEIEQTVVASSTSDGKMKCQDEFSEKVEEVVAIRKNYKIHEKIVTKRIDLYFKYLGTKC